jgi:hypothetical protein
LAERPHLDRPRRLEAEDEFSADILLGEDGQPNTGGADHGPGLRQQPSHEAGDQDQANRHEEGDQDQAKRHETKPDRGFRVGMLQVLTPDDCETAIPRAYVVKGLINRSDMAMISATYGTGKSAWAPALGYAIAQGRPFFHGIRVKQVPVVYVASEDGDGMTVRVRVLKKQFGSAPDFYLILVLPGATSYPGCV